MTSRAFRFIFHDVTELFKILFNHFYNIAHFHIKRTGNTVKSFKRWFALAPFNSRQMRSAYICESA